MLTVGCRAKSLPGASTKPVLPHDSRDSVLPDPVSPPSELLCDSWLATSVLHMLLDHQYLFLKPFLGVLSLAQQPTAPCIIPTAWYPEYSCHRSHAVGSLVIPYEPKLHFFGFEKMATAFRKMSRSSVTSASSLRSRYNSSSRGLP